MVEPSEAAILTIARIVGWVADGSQCPTDCPYCRDELNDAKPRVAALITALSEAGYQIVASPPLTSAEGD